MQDSPLGIRFSKFFVRARPFLCVNSRAADFNSAFPSGMNAAATWSTRLMKERGNAMGSEHRGKGIDMQLGPFAGPLGRVPAGGRNWEGQ